MPEDQTGTQIRLADIMAYQMKEGTETGLKESDIELHIMPIEYAKGKMRPLDYVKFYKHKALTSIFPVRE